MGKKNRLITPEGTRDILFADCIARRTVEQNIKARFLAHGFSEVVTPGLEFYDVFNSENHGFPEEAVYKLTDPKGRILAVKPDLTMPIARLVATRLKGHTPPFRLFYNQNVYTMSPALSGHSDEITQIGIEVIGSSSRRADLEVLALAVEALQSCGLSDFRLEIGHIGFFNLLIRELALTDDESEEIRRLIEAKNYPALNDRLDMLPNREAANALKQLPALFGGEEVFARAAGLLQNAQLAETAAYLQSIYRDLTRLGLGAYISLDLGLVNRNDYYTGIVFKGYVQGLGTVALSGGRYDSLLSDYGVDLPAIGFGIDVDAVSRVIRDPLIEVPAADAIVWAAPGREVEGLLLVQRLIDEGKCAQLSPFDTLEETRSYAEEKGIAAVYTEKPEVEA